jgi:hypothetical protein
VGRGFPEVAEIHYVKKKKRSMPHEKVPLNWLTADDDPEY